MLPWRPWIIVLIALIGNCGFWLFLFNRLNAIGWNRTLTKRLEKTIVATCFLIPAVLVTVEYPALLNWFREARWWPAEAPAFAVWAAWCLASCVVLGTLWLESRRWLIPPPQLLASRGQLHSIGANLSGGSTLDRWTGLLARFPGNQITHLEVTRKELQLPRAVEGIDGFKLGHLSDIHFSGQFRREHYQSVMDHFLALEPDLIVLTGDIIDFDRYLDWIPDILGRLQAPLGCTFLLGNHDLRLKQVSPLLEQMRRLQHVDVGCQNQTLHWGGVEIEISGNEQPWFERHPPPLESKPATRPAEDRSRTLRIGLSHSPDQIGWARRQQLDLLLAGHTHGGQARFPLIGPILAPSLYGSKFASGVFYLPPTLMHVSRGIAGTHAMRWWCPPEVSLLTLRNP